MSGKSNSPTIPAAELHQVRAAIVTEGVRGLLIINGGGIVALLAFLQAIWSTNEALAKVVLVGIGFLCLGVTFAVLVNFFRYHTSINKQANNQGRKNTFSFLSFTCMYASIVAFLAASCVLVVGAWIILA